jgi:hypothetical protein
MKRLLPIICIFANCLCFAGPVTEPKFAGDWSVPTNGLRGRLLLAERAQDKFDVQNKGKQGVVYLELQNLALGDTIYVYYDAKKSPLHCELQDSTGNAVKPYNAVFSDWRPYPCWLALPHDSTLRFSATILTGSPVNALVISVGEALTGGAWEMPLDSTNDYYLSGAFTSMSSTGETRPRVWEGTLKLPPVKISVKNSDAKR